MSNTFKRGALNIERESGRLIFRTGAAYAAPLDPAEVQEFLDWLQPSLSERVANEVMERAASPDYTPETNENQAFEAFRHALPAGKRWSVSPVNFVRVEGESIASGETLAIAFCHAALHLVSQ